MRARDFKTFSPEDADVARLQDNIGDAIYPLINNPLTGHILVGPVTVETTPTTIAHKFDGQLQGWVMVAPNADARVWEVARTKKTLTLQASSQVTCSILVF